MASLTSITLNAQQTPNGIFDDHCDIGNVKLKGSVKFDADKQEYLIAGSGTNMWFDRDEFQYLWKKVKGDFILRARIEFLGEGVDPHRKAGWIIRKDTSTGSVHANASLHGNGLTSLQFRRTPGGETEEVRLEITAPDVIQLERKGNTLIMSVARFGDTLTTCQVNDLPLPDEVYAGLYVCSHNPDVVENAVFRDVRIIFPAPDDFVPYQDYIGSHIEVVDVGTGYRKIRYSSPKSLQAPNWTTDGKSLIFNSEGKIFTLDLQTGQPEVLQTGFAISNNNDHVLSFDGKYLGISNHSNDDGGKSIIYTLPAAGGIPTRITPSGPSYLHGWSPDGKYLVYTAERNSKYDIYCIPSGGGEEVRLTTADGLDDGPEYTPDGQYIYFNSNRTGNMQIWRMHADGSNQEQITTDAFNNWFPHISPDGKTFVYLAFPSDINPGDHPFYKRVYLMIRPLDKGESRVIAYIYGGQGTINVPSWSPDGRKIAFVSNSIIR